MAEATPSRVKADGGVRTSIDEDPGPEKWDGGFIFEANWVRLVDNNCKVAFTGVMADKISS